jgi:cytochrome c2
MAALGAVAAMSLPSTSIAADMAHGRDLFKTQCGICHRAGEGDGDGVVGPSLKGLIGRKVGGDPAFSYTPAMTDDKDMWTEASLAAFLEDPQKAVPGTAMPIRVASPADRADLAGYLATVKAAP